MHEPSTLPVMVIDDEPHLRITASQTLELAGYTPHCFESAEQALAALAIAAFEAGIRRFVVAGGETSGAVAQALGLSRLDIGTEIAPGVPWTFSRVRGEDIAITLKSGNFGDGDFFATALARLEE